MTANSTNQSYLLNKRILALSAFRSRYAFIFIDRTSIQTCLECFCALFQAMQSDNLDKKEECSGEADILPNAFLQTSSGVFHDDGWLIIALILRFSTTKYVYTEATLDLGHCSYRPHILFSKHTKIFWHWFL